eukprot:6212188-Pleurochrysis_carterae.AAC.1
MQANMGVYSPDAGGRMQSLPLTDWNWERLPRLTCRSVVHRVEAGPAHRDKQVAAHCDQETTCLGEETSHQGDAATARGVAAAAYRGQKEASHRRR